MKFTITASSDERDLIQCAQLMSETDPWITLQRDYNSCMDAMHGDYKEVYIVKRNYQVLGFIVLQMAGVFKGYIQSICVSPDARSSGIGTELIRFAEKRIFSVSPNVFMLVSTFNTKAADLYFRLGYKKIGILENFAANGLDEFLLRKTIGSLKSFSSTNF